MLIHTFTYTHTHLNAHMQAETIRHCMITIHSIRPNLTQRCLASVNRRYADRVSVNGVRERRSLRTEFESDILSRYRERLCARSDAENIFDDLVVADMYVRIFCEIQN